MAAVNDFPTNSPCPAHIARMKATYGGA